MIDPDYCDHGIHLRKPCYFCRRGRLEPRKAEEPRNPRSKADEEIRAANRRPSIFRGRGVAGGKATAAKFALTGRRKRT